MGTAVVRAAGGRAAGMAEELRRNRRSQRGRCLASLLFPVAAVLGPGSVAHAGTVLPSFTSSPGSGPPGTAIVASGSGCTDDKGGELSLRMVGDDSPIATASIGATDDGGWASTLIVPSRASAGGYVLGAVCAFGQGTPNVYAEHSFRVTAPAGGGGRLSAVPSSVPVGGTVQVGGTGCPRTGFAIAAVTQEGSELEGAQVGTPNADGRWSVAFTLKEGYVNPDAAIAVRAQCFDAAERVRFTYDELPLEVTAGARSRSGRQGRAAAGTEISARTETSPATQPSAVAVTTTTAPGGEQVRLAADGGADKHRSPAAPPVIGAALLAAAGSAVFWVVRRLTRH